MGVRDLEIARSVTLKPIQEIGEALGLGADDLEPYGRLKAKVRWEAVARAAKGPDGALVLVTAMTPTPAGEGKSTTTVGLADGFRKIGRRSIVALREPSLGPVFGMTKRVLAWEKHYPWISKDTLEYFRTRPPRARKDSLEAIDFVIQHATTYELQARCVDALIRKTEILWHLLDSLYAAYVEPGWGPGGARA